MIQITPLSGYRNVTEFTFIVSPTANDSFVNWGDSSFDSSSNVTHIFSSIGIFNSYGGTCSSTSAFSISVYNGEYFSDKITVERDAISSVVSCPFSFTINLSSSSQTNTVILYASGSQSSPYQQNRNFWSHLNPEWEFLYNNEVVSEIKITGNPVYSGNTIIGYSASSAVQFLDDMPGNPILFFTVVKTEGDIPINSRVYSAFSHSICAIDPDKLFITSDGINPINEIQWADKNIPYIISVGSSQTSCTTILHYISGNITGINFRSDCFGLDESNFQYNESSINLKDSNCFPTGGYILSSFYYPSSALPPITITNDSDQCNNNFDKIEFYKTRLTPQGVILSATGTFGYNGNSYNLSGVSDKFNILAFENRHAFYRKGEDYNVYEILKTSLPFDIDTYPNFNRYLSAVAGEGDSLGIAYDKIDNFSKDHSDIDICTYDSLINKAEMFDSEIDDFGLQMPEELKRIFNFSTIPLQKLIGTRCVCNTNFINCNGCAGKNICTICKFDKRSNLGSQIVLTDYITAGETILYKESGGEFYNFYVVQNQSSNVYQLQSLSAEPFYSKGLNNYCFFKWDKTPQNNPVQSVVNYKDSRNMLNPTLSSNEDWYADNGIVEEMFNYILTKNLLN
jgi:hypothetical protein